VQRGRAVPKSLQASAEQVKEAGRSILA
jgi:hypothetical protein